MRSIRGNDRTSFWFPLVTMVASVLFAVYAVMPRSVFDAFAANDNTYCISVSSKEGSFFVTLTGDNTTAIDLSGSEAVKTVNEQQGTVTYDLTLTSDLTSFVIRSKKPVKSLSFGEGADAVTVIDASDSGLEQLDVSKCTGLTSLDVADCPVESDLLSIECNSKAAQSVHIGTPALTYNDTGVLFDLKGFGQADDLTVKQNNKTLQKADGHYCIPYADLKEDMEKADDGVSLVKITKADKPGVTYVFGIMSGDVSDSDVLNPQESQSGSSDNQGDKDSQGDKENQSGKDNQDDSQNDAPNVKLTVDESSKSIIKDAYIENVAGVDASGLKAVAKALSTADKKTLLAAVKKADKDFDDKNPDMLVYDIYLTDKNGKKVSVKGKAGVTLTLAYPSREIGYLYDEYDYTAYHQLSDKSIDKSIDVYGTKEGVQFITDDFSKFVISCSKKAQKYTDLVIHNNSKDIIKAAKAHEGSAFITDEDSTEFGADVTWIMAEAPTAEEKNEFFEAIKKVNKDFNAKDSNLIVYKVSLRSIQNDVLARLSKGKVDFTLVYPNDTLKKKYSNYNYTVYHQLADKSIDTKQIAVAGADGVTVTTDGFSLFAVAATPKPTDPASPKTGESTVAANIAFLLAMLSVAGFAAVIAKNKAEQY